MVEERYAQHRCGLKKLLRQREIFWARLNRTGRVIVAMMIRVSSRRIATRNTSRGGCVQKFADTGCGNGLYKYFSAGPLEIIQLLENIRNLLLRYENYQLALTEDLIFSRDVTSTTEIPEIRPSFVRLNDNLVIMEIVAEENGKTVYRWAAIEKPVIAVLFMSIFSLFES